MRNHTEPLKPDYLSIRFPDPPEDRPYVLINMVTSADGRAVIEGTERGLGTPTDQRLMRELRVLADVVMNGAGTLRTSGTSSRLNDPELELLREHRGGGRAATAAVLSNSGVLPLDARFFKAEDFRRLIFVGHATSEGNREAIAQTGCRVVVLPEEEPLRFALRYLRHEEQARVLLVEGGPTLNGALFDAGLVDEYFMTLAPRIVAGHPTLPATRSDREPDLDRVQHMELLAAVPNPATGEVYLRYRVRRADQEG